VFITFKIGFDKLDFKGKYQINAQILLLNIVGEGDLTGIFRKSYTNFYSNIMYDNEIISKLFTKKDNTKNLQQYSLFTYYIFCS